MERPASTSGAETHSAGTPSTSTFSHLASGAPPRNAPIFAKRARESMTAWVAGAGRERSRVIRLSSCEMVIVSSNRQSAMNEAAGQPRPLAGAGARGSGERRGRRWPLRLVRRFFFLVATRISNAAASDSLGNPAPERQRPRLWHSQRAHYGQWPAFEARKQRPFPPAIAHNRCSARDHAVLRA